jgi:ribosomal protein S18 acetylase RimI-like enzyme
VLIRAAIVTDVRRIAPLVRQYWDFEAIAGFHQPRIESLIQGLLAAPERGACWVAETQGDLVGYLLAAYIFSLEHGGLMAEIDELFVTPAGRCAGVGSRLLETAQRDMQARGLVRVQLQLAVGNGRAREFYARHGFTSRAGYELVDKPLGESSP